MQMNSEMNMNKPSEDQVNIPVKIAKKVSVLEEKLQNTYHVYLKEKGKTCSY